jgi:hypothetical protein
MLLLCRLADLRERSFAYKTLTDSLRIHCAARQGEAHKTGSCACSGASCVASGHVPKSCLVCSTAARFYSSPLLRLFSTEPEARYIIPRLRRALFLRHFMNFLVCVTSSAKRSLALRGVSLFFLKRKLQRRASRRAKCKARDARSTNSKAQGARLRERRVKRKAQGAICETEISQQRDQRRRYHSKRYPHKRRTGQKKAQGGAREVRGERAAVLQQIC